VGFLDDDDDPELREFLGHIVGPESAGEVLSQMRASGMDPRAMLGENGKLPDPVMIQAAMANIRRMMESGGDGPVNEVIAHDVARQAAMQGGDPVISGAQAEQIRSAFRTAELWLDVATDFSPAPVASKAWSRAEWVEATLPTWNRLVAPVAAAMSEALVKVMGPQFEPSEFDLPEAEQSGGLNESALARMGLGGLQPQQLLQRLGATAYGIQVGQAAGGLSREVFGVTDLGLPLLAEAGTVMLPNNVDEYAKDLEISPEQVREYLAVREAAAARLFSSVPWLRAHLVNLIEQYASQTEIDLRSFEDQLRGVDPSSQEQLGKAMSAGIFAPRATAEQQATLLKLETALALIEGWIEEVTTAATIAHLPQAMALREMLRRRRGAGGPAEQAFQSLVGLDLRPRRSREAAKLFSHVYTAGGVPGRDAVWDHPDLLPGPADLDDPAGYLARRMVQDEEGADLDAALQQLLSGGFDNLTPNDEGSASDDQA
jgi:putative hydrolase